jgi:hypothetical protein
MNIWETINKIKAQAPTLRSLHNGDTDFWYQFDEFTDLHFFSEDGTQHEIMAYPVIRHEDGSFTTDTSSGIQIF